MSAKEKDYESGTSNKEKHAGDKSQNKRERPRKKFERSFSSSKPALQFYASILTNSSHEIAASLNDKKKMIDLMHGVCERAGVPLPEKLPLTYRNSHDYFLMQASLVLEESRYMLAEILHNSSDELSGMEKPLWLDLVGMESPNRRKVGFILQFEKRINGSPVSFRENEMIYMRPGCVFEVSFKNTGGYNPTQNETTNITMLACVTPGCYENDHSHKSGLSLTVFPKQQLFLRQGTIWRIQFLTTLISEQRQFEACIGNPKIAFIDTLLGWKTKSHAISAGDDDIIAEKDSNWPSALESFFYIPKLNTLQEKTAVKFLQSPPSSVTLVQGPPGTGKTTFIATLLCRSLCSVRKDGSLKIDHKKRILVTAPTNKAVIVLASRFLSYMKDCMTLNIVLIGVENKLVDGEYGNHRRDAYSDPFTAASLSPSLRSIFVYTWLDEIVKEILSFREYLQLSSYTPEKRRILISRASVLARRLHSSLPSIVEKTGSLYWAQELVASLQRLPTDLSTNPSALMGKLQQTESCIKDFVDILDQINRFEANQELLDAANIIFCTLSTAGVAAMKRTRRINDIFVDEAASATEPDILIPLHLNPERMLAVGDPKQLPATLNSRYAIDCGLDKSLIDRLMFDCSHEYTMLDKQYRMHPEIRSFPSRIFYKGKIIDGNNVLRSDFKGKTSILDGSPYSFLQVHGPEERSVNYSYHNMKEAQTVVDIVRSIYLASQKVDGNGAQWYTAEKLRIITFYGGQVSCIKKLLAKNGFGMVTCATVDSSQGCEADIVIISFVRSNANTGKNQKTGFLQDERRINVALTRAKFQLICIGDASNTLNVSGVPVLKSMVDDANVRGLLSDTESFNKSPVCNKIEEYRNHDTTHQKKYTEYEGKSWQRSHSDSSYTHRNSAIKSTVCSKIEEIGNVKHSIMPKKEYTEYVEESRQRNNSHSSNGHSDYKTLETGHKKNLSNSVNSLPLEYNKVYTGYVKKKRQWSHSESSDNNSACTKSRKRMSRNYGSPAYAKVDTEYLKEQKNFSGKSSDITHNSAETKECTTLVEKFRPSSNFNMYESELDHAKFEPNTNGKNSPKKLKTHTSSTRQCIGYATEHMKNQDSSNNNQLQTILKSTENSRYQSQLFQDELSKEEKDGCNLENNQKEDSQTKTPKEKTSFTQTEKDVIKAALLEKIALLQKQVEKIDEL